jgi:hypothetical protein
MDYIFMAAVLRVIMMAAMLITVSYDIACQWSINFFERIRNRMPAALQLPDFVQLRFAVPKFHLPAHVKKCWTPFSFNFMKWVGRTDGEGVERVWSWLNGVARSVSMMGAGGRQDTLDDFCNFWNWKKTTELGKCEDQHHNNC